MKMKQTALILMFFIGCGTLLFGQSAGTEVSLVPFTWEHVNLLQNINPDKLKELEFYLSNTASIIPKQDNTSNKADIINGALAINNGQNTPTGEKVINTTDKGTLRTREPATESIVIYFNDTPLRFRRNSQGRYVLISAEIDLETNTLFIRSQGGQPIQLLIKYSNTGLNSRVEMQAVPDSEPGGSQRGTNVQQPAYRDSGQSYQTINIGSSANQFGPSRNIDGQSYVNRRGIIEYVRRQGSSVDNGTLNRLIEKYFEEAGIEGVNLDIAIAQMLYATNFLRNRMTTHNYAGLNTNGIPWNGTFPDRLNPNRLNDGMAEGVRAHIQHLKGYASRAPLSRPCVDPRYDVLVRLGYQGKASTFSELYGYWAENSNYGSNIERILRGLWSSAN